MVPLAALRTTMLVRAAEIANRTFVLPVVLVQPTSRCNSRCVSCDWWRSSGETDLTVAEFDQLAGQLPQFGTRLVVFSGGEPLLRPDMFEIAGLFRRRGLDLHLLTSGLALERHAEAVARTFARVVISLDAATEAEYHAVRGVHGLVAVERGVARLRELAPTVPVTARTTLHRLNFRALPAIVAHARAMALDQVSFLAADLGSLAFGRSQPLDAAGLAALALSRDEAREFADIVEAVIGAHAADFASGFIAESPDRLRRLPRYYAALQGDGPLPPVQCNAPWMSLVVEADGTVRPCFFHAPLGNLRADSLATIVETRLASFRGALDVASNGQCQRCVCAIRTGWRSAPWL